MGGEYGEDLKLFCFKDAGKSFITDLWISDDRVNETTDPEKFAKAN